MTTICICLYATEVYDLVSGRVYFTVPSNKIITIHYKKNII